MKKFQVLFRILLAVLLFFPIYSCKKDAIKTAPVVSITSVSNITATSASSGGLITSTGGASVTAAGVCWSTNQNPTISDNKTSDGISSTSFSSTLNGLIQGTTYYIKAYATNSVGTSYSTQLTFSTLALAPAITTTDLSAITSTTATGGGNITNDGGSPITARGICWGAGQNPTTADNKTTDGTGSGIFTSSITGLTPGATFYVRAYATNSIGTSYGSQKTLVTVAVLSTVTTTAVTINSATSATGGGNVTSDGGASIIARGVCWSTSQNPTITDSKTTDIGTTGVFTSSITGLIPGTTYYFKAYATTNVGTSYGDQVTATTTSTLATLTTTAVSNELGTSATSGGNITIAGGTITARGVCWSTTEDPTIGNSKTTESGSTGSFSSSITGLTLGLTYYIRAYATNSVGTSYGNQITYQNFVIGQSFQGGLLAYIYQNGDPGYVSGEVHGLVAASTNQSTGIRWNNGISVQTGASATLLGTGFANTNTIIAIQGDVSTSYAAGLARAYNGGDYNDWFLPSRDELSKLYYGLKTAGLGAFSNYPYCSSSEYGSGGIWYIDFTDGTAGPGVSKSNLLYLRAIRYF